MTNAQATAKAKKLWGNSFYVRNNERMSSAERRDKGREQKQHGRSRTL